MHARILYVVGQLRAGGLERQLCYLLQSMDRERYRPAVAVWRFREDDFYVARLRQLSIPIHFPTEGIPGLRKLHWLRGLVGRLQPEVIHSYSFYTNFAAAYSSFGTKVTAVGSVRSDFLRAISDSGLGLGTLCARWPRVQIFNSVAAAENVRNFRGPFRPQKVLVVRNGVDLERFTTTPIPTHGRTTIVAVGSLSPVKRWDRLLNAAHRLKRDGFEFVVKIAGDGPLRGDLEAQARQLGVHDCVDFIGQTDDVPALLAQATILVHTSASEGCPNVVMEAMACGRPVFATDVGDTRYIVVHGKTGFVVENGDDQVFATRLATLISDRELCTEMGAAGRVKAERDFGLDRLVKETVSAYTVAGWQDKQS